MPMTEFAGTLTSRLELFAKSDERSASGASSAEWHMIDRCLARVEAEGVGNPIEAMAISAMPRFRVTVRKGPAFAIDQQIGWAGRRLAIRQVVDDPQMLDRLVLRCEELRP